MPSENQGHNSPPIPAAARLSVVMPVAAVGFFIGALLDYALPLYFRFLSDGSARVFVGGSSAYPVDVWSNLVKYQTTAMIVSPIIAGMLAQRYGARVVWSLSLLGLAAVPLILAGHPVPQFIPVIALWYGITSSFIWTAGISLVQLVASPNRARANGQMLVMLGVGSLCGPLVGRLFLYRLEFQLFMSNRTWSLGDLQVMGGSPIATPPHLAEFQETFFFLAVVSILAGLAIGFAGQNKGQGSISQATKALDPMREIIELLMLPRFRVLAVTVCFFAVIPLQASNQFLPYRAESLGLLSGNQDTGWLGLQLLRTSTWVLGGVAVGRLGKRRINGFTVVVIMVATAFASVVIAFSTAAWQLFASVAMFEFVRQFVRWLNTAFVSDQVPTELGAAAIGLSLAIGGIANALFGWAAASVWSGPTASAGPFLAAATLTVIGAVGFLLVSGPRLVTGPEPKLGTDTPGGTQ